ncbi:hypothetical protein UR09_06570 [Candidatus Nitromaritima sp. SCGC AAA799-A02]|nr:hypothetical protein UR09_06570 [Candidatus Nitromaritima sp. SCGC AAA799-A02]
MSFEQRLGFEKKYDQQRSVLNTVVDGIMAIDAKGVVEVFNPGAERIFGCKDSEIIGKNVNLLMPEPYCSEHDVYVQKYLKTGMSKIMGIGREVVDLKKDGTTFPMDLAISEF